MKNLKERMGLFERPSNERWSLARQGETEVELSIAA